MITNQIPETWNELQNKVAEILEQCGFEVEIEKKIKSIRGSVEIDVYAEEKVNNRTYSILCECKHWKTNIPQNVIHGFRTVLSDLGANIGYIITTSNFQIGSIESVKKTNIKLLTWNDFQNIFFETWYRKYFCSPKGDLRLFYDDYNIVSWFDDLNQKDRKRYFQIRNILNEIHEINSLFPAPFMLNIDGIDATFPTLPLSSSHIDLNEYYGDLPISVFNASDYESFLKEITSLRNKFVIEFNNLNEKYQTE